MKLRQKTLALVISILLLISFSTSAYADAPGLPSFPDPVDPQSWKLQRDMTWDDWKDNPVIDWNEANKIEPERVLKGALILVDFLDRPFIVTEDKGSELIGNPVIDAIPEEELVDFWVDFLNTPQEINNYRTINEFWRENSYGKWAVELEGFGPFHLQHNEYEYGLDNGMNSFVGSRNTGRDTYELCKDVVPFDKFDFFFVLHSGYDESGVWQELGEMMFQSKEEVTDEFGPSEQLLEAIEDKTDSFGPNSSLSKIYEELGFIPNWLPTRYVPWTSAYAAKGIWSHASGVTDSQTGKRISFSVQGENDGMATFAHEFGHIMQLGDNYNNPYGIPVSRSYTGSWETMSRGSFNGPGGPHTRWMIPSTLGSSAPAPHMLRNSIVQGFTDDEDIIRVNRDDLAQSGPVFADIVARVIPVGEDFGIEGYRGLEIDMVDYAPIISLKDDWRADTQSGPYNNYTIEVVGRVGYDSFALDSGVLIAKTKDKGSIYTWLIDAHPEDINLVDFIRPDGTEAMLSKGDMNQLADAAFHAGTGEDVVSEYVDKYNRLHFYILDKNCDENGVLSYRVAVRNLDGAGDFKRGLNVEESNFEPAVPGRVAVQYFSVTNTGEETDLIRVEAATEAGWEVMLLHNVIEVKAGETVEVPVYVQIPQNNKAGNKTPNLNVLTFTATSETDSEQSEIINVKINHSPGNANGKIK